MKANKEKTILITGASSGIGREIALRLALQDHEIVCVGRDEKRLSSIHDKINSQGGKAQYIVCDLFQESRRANLLEEFKHKTSGRLDALINAAGQQSVTPLMLNNSDLWRDLMEVNVVAPAELSRIFLPALNQGASIVNIASVGAIKASAGMSVYAASKAALISYTKTAAVELASKQIRVNAVLPGMVKTPMLEEMFTFYTEAQKEKLERKHPLGFVPADQVAAAVDFLISDAAQYITGLSLVVDGGFSLS